jgi:hypothetical protein
MQGKGLVVHSFSLSLFGECYSYSIPPFLTDLSGYKFMIIAQLFVELVKKVYDKLRIYKDMSQKILIKER